MKPPNSQGFSKQFSSACPPSGCRSVRACWNAPCGGSGALTLALREGIHAIGADVDPKAESGLETRFAKVDLNAVLPWPDQIFDAIFQRRESSIWRIIFRSCARCAAS